MAKLVVVPKDEVQRSHERLRELMEEDPHLKAEMDAKTRRRSEEKARRARGGADEEA